MGFTDDDCFEGECDLCGEKFDTRSKDPSMYEIGEFYDHETGEHYICHAQCGLDRGYSLA